MVRLLRHDRLRVSRGSKSKLNLGQEARDSSEKPPSIVNVFDVLSSLDFRSLCKLVLRFVANRKYFGASLGE